MYLGLSANGAKLLSKEQWAGPLGLQMSPGWVNYALSTKREPHILLFKMLKNSGAGSIESQGSPQGSDVPMPFFRHKTGAGEVKKPIDKEATMATPMSRLGNVGSEPRFPGDQRASISQRAQGSEGGESAMGGGNNGTGGRPATQAITRSGTSGAQRRRLQLQVKKRPAVLKKPAIAVSRRT